MPRFIPHPVCPLYMMTFVVYACFAAVVLRLTMSKFRVKASDFEQRIGLIFGFSIPAITWKYGTT